MYKDKNKLSYAGLQKLEKELDFLQTEKRKELAEKIKWAREQDDLTENAEYYDARDEQIAMEARINEIKDILKNAVIIDEVDIKDGVVGIGCNVVVRDLEYGDEETFTIVGDTEADSLSGKISSASPIGRALTGAKIGDEVEAHVPAGLLKYKIIDIKRE